jgi:hypothetical protein
MEFYELGSEGTDWIDLDQDRGAVVNAVMNPWVPQNARDFLTS